jgi:hypothetical protein
MCNTLAVQEGQALHILKENCLHIKLKRLFPTQAEERNQDDGVFSLPNNLEGVKKPYHVFLPFMVVVAVALTIMGVFSEIFVDVELGLLSGGNEL